MEKCGYCSEIACSAPGSFCSTVVNLTMRAVDLTGSRAEAMAQWRTAVCGRMTFGANQVLVRAPDHCRDKTIGCHSSPDPGQPFFNLIICRARLSLGPD